MSLNDADLSEDSEELAAGATKPKVAITSTLEAVYKRTPISNKNALLRAALGFVRDRFQEVEQEMDDYTYKLEGLSKALRVRPEDDMSETSPVLLGYKTLAALTEEASKRIPVLVAEIGGSRGTAAALEEILYSGKEREQLRIQEQVRGKEVREQMNFRTTAIVPYRPRL